MIPNKFPKRQYHFAKHTQAGKEQQAHDDVTVVTVQRSSLSRIVVKVNVIRPICSLMFGRNHSVLIRMGAGVVIAATGVVVAKYFGHSHDPIVSYFGDGIGYGLHGLGLTPFIEYMAETFE